MSITEPTRGVLDTSVVIGHDAIDPGLLPDESAISAVTLAELAAGPHATEDKDERARRQDRLQWATANWDPLPFDAESARMYGRMFAAARAAGQSSRTRLADLLIASTAAANELPLYTRNPSDFDALKRILKIISI
jgi:predicted nucleic acid-binding protein